MIYKTAKLSPRCSLAMIDARQNIPWVQFDYNFHVPNHTLGDVNIGYGLAVTLVQEHTASFL